MNPALYLLLLFPTSVDTSSKTICIEAVQIGQPWIKRLQINQPLASAVQIGQPFVDAIQAGCD